MLPSAPVYLSFPVHPGDVMNAKIKEISNNCWSICISDVTDGHSYTSHFYYVSCMASADWIEETHCCGLVPFSNGNFGPYFTGTNYNMANGNCIEYAGAITEVSMKQGSTCLAYPSVLGPLPYCDPTPPTADSFTVTWEASS